MPEFTSKSIRPSPEKAHKDSLRSPFQCGISLAHDIGREQTPPMIRPNDTPEIKIRARAPSYLEVMMMMVVVAVIVVVDIMTAFPTFAFSIHKGKKSKREYTETGRSS